MQQLAPKHAAHEQCSCSVACAGWQGPVTAETGLYDILYYSFAYLQKQGYAGVRYPVVVCAGLSHKAVCMLASLMLGSAYMLTCEVALWCPLTTCHKKF